MKNIPLVGTLSKGQMSKALNVAFDRDYYFVPERRHRIDTLCNQYASDEFADLDIFFTESNLGQRPFFSDNQVLIGGIQPNMILGMLVGASFIPNPSMDAEISITPLKGLDPADYPSPEDLLQHELVRLFDTQIKEVRAEGRFYPIPPFFWDSSGMAAVHGVLTTAQKLVREDIFMDLVMAPDKAQEILHWIGNCFITLMQHFSETGRMEVTSVHVGECSGCMVNAELFSELVVPESSRLAYDDISLRMHSCGTSDHLLDAIHSIPNLGSIDIGGDASMAAVRKVFGPEMQVDIAPMPADLSVESPDHVINWAAKVVDDNNGGNLRIIYHLEPDYRMENIRALNEFLVRL